MVEPDPVLEPDEFDGLFADLNIDESEIKISFQVEGYKFWINKSAGYIRRKQRAILAVKYLFDDIGMAEGKYDGIIDSIMQGVVADAEPPIPMENGGFDRWCENLPISADNGSAVQMMMGITLPRVVAMVMLGKSQVSQIMALRETSTPPSSGESSASDTESTAPKAAASMITRSKPPVRDFLPEVAKAG